MTRIYTRKGDKGQTSQLTGHRLPKNHRIMEACGDVDELNSVIGTLISIFPIQHENIRMELDGIQARLLAIGSRISSLPEPVDADKLPPLTPDHLKTLESAIDRLDATLPPLRNFILPGGHFSSALAHIARTVCRRAERHVVTLSRSRIRGKPVTSLKTVLAYLNRLSDYLFMVARYCNKISGNPESIWHNKTDLLA